MAEIPSRIRLGCLRQLKETNHDCETHAVPIKVGSSILIGWEIRDRRKRHQRRSHDQRQASKHRQENVVVEVPKPEAIAEKLQCFHQYDDILYIICEMIIMKLFHGPYL